MYRVLYVDDEESLLELAKIFLERGGEFDVDTISSVPDAIEKIRVVLYDAIVSDYQMPETDGIAFLKEVRSAFGSIPFILFTGKGREEVVIEAINNGVDFYIQKGGDPKAQFAELSHKIRQAVSRRHSEIALSDSEQRLADIINFLPDATFAIDMDGCVIAWNHAIEEMTGIPAREILGKGEYTYAVPFYGERRPLLIDLVFEPDETIARYYANIRREGNALSAESNLPHPRGRRIDVLAKASPLYNRNGEITGAIEAIRDITDRKRAEEDLWAANEQLAASEEELREQYQELARNEQKVRENDSRLRYMIGFYDRTRDAEKDLLNYAVEGAGAVTGSPLGYLAFLNEDESELAMYAWSKTAMTECSMREKPIVYKTEKTGLWGEAVRQRRPIITNDYAAPNPAKKGYPNGHPVITRHMNIPVLEEGHIVLVAGVANKPADYTEDDVYQLSLLMQSLWLVLKRRRSEDALLEREIKFRTLFNNANDAIYIHEVLPDNLPGRFIEVNDTLCSRLGYTREELLTMSVSDIVSDAHRQKMPGISKRLAKAMVHTFYAEHKRKDGFVFPVEINSRRFAFSGRDVVLAATRDITERKRAEEALALANQKLNLLSGITRHDIKNQLFVMKGYLDLSRNSLGDPAKMAEYIAKEEQAADAIEEQINFTREYEDLGVNSPVWQNMENCIALAAREMDLSAAELSVSSLKNVEVFADPLFRKAVFNLMDNSLRHGGRSRTKIQFSSHESENGLVISCEDDGAGIPAPDKERIFERGYGKNTGFGLFFIREILALTGIAIQETGEPGKGARFEITVPKGAYRFTGNPATRHRNHQEKG